MILESGLLSPHRIYTGDPPALPSPYEMFPLLARQISARPLAIVMHQFDDFRRGDGTDFLSSQQDFSIDVSAPTRYHGAWRVLLTPKQKQPVVCGRKWETILIIGDREPTDMLNADIRLVFTQIKGKAAAWSQEADRLFDQ